MFNATIFFFFKKKIELSLLLSHNSKLIAGELPSCLKMLTDEYNLLVDAAVNV